MHYQASDDLLKPYVDLVRSKDETKDKVLSLAKSHNENCLYCAVYVRILFLILFITVECLCNILLV